MAGEIGLTGLSRIGAASETSSQQKNTIAQKPVAQKSMNINWRVAVGSNVGLRYWCPIVVTLLWVSLSYFTLYTAF
jgi:hypothetical protein